MNLCLGQRLDEPGWTGLPLGHFAPLGHETALPVAASQDTLFFWKAGASPASVRHRGNPQRYERGDRVIDFMAADEEAFIAHDRPEAPGEALVVAIPALTRPAITTYTTSAAMSACHLRGGHRFVQQLGDRLSGQPGDASRWSSPAEAGVKLRNSIAWPTTFRGRQGLRARAGG